MKARWETGRTRLKTVRGVKFTEKGMRVLPIDVRVTSDENGSSLSLAVDGDVLLQISMEAVSDLIVLAKDS